MDACGIDGMEMLNGHSMAFPTSLKGKEMIM